MIERASVTMLKHLPVTGPTNAVPSQRPISASGFHLYILLPILALLLGACTSDTSDLPPGEAGISSGGVNTGAEDSDSADVDGDTPDEEDSLPAEAAEESGTVSTFAGLRTTETVIGRLLVEADSGLTLYTFESDPAGVSTCAGSCLVVWPPLLASSAQLAQLNAMQAAALPYTLLDGLGIIERSDQSLQFTFNGSPLYRFEGDAAEGDINGEGQGDVWFSARPFAWQLASDSQGFLFFAGQGSVNAGVDDPSVRKTEFTDLSLYQFAQDTPGFSFCNTGCMENNPPLHADKGARPVGAFTIITRNNGAPQWAFNGLPLYYFFGDANPGDLFGDQPNGVWFAARP